MTSFLNNFSDISYVLERLLPDTFLLAQNKLTLDNLFLLVLDLFFAEL